MSFTDVNPTASCGHNNYNNYNGNYYCNCNNIITTIIIICCNGRLSLCSDWPPKEEKPTGPSAPGRYSNGPPDNSNGHISAAFCIRRNANGAMQTAQCNAMTKRNPAKRVQNRRALLAHYFIQSAVAEWKSK